MVPRVEIGVIDQGFGKTPDYTRLVERAGARATVVRWQEERDAIADAGRFDALLLCGGDDPAGRLFGQDDHPSITRDADRRDAYEIALCRAAREYRVPLLGVCRGMQMLNIALGGDLDQHLPDVPGRDDHSGGVRHALRLAAGSCLARLSTGVAAPAVNSYHHQAVGRVAPGLVATAWTPDGCVEAVEDAGPDDPFCMGVQWHPEKAGNTAGLGERLFEALVEAARRRGGAI